MGQRKDQAEVNRYFFNFRKGDEISRDWVGMYLHDLEEARQEALRTRRELLPLAIEAGEAPCEDCEIQIADASGEPVLTIPFGAPPSHH
jgi:hypothetical protein